MSRLNPHTQVSYVAAFIAPHWPVTEVISAQGRGDKGLSTCWAKLLLTDGHNFALHLDSQTQLSKPLYSACHSHVFSASAAGGPCRVRVSGTELLIPSYLPPGFLPLQAHAGAGRAYSLTCPAYCLMHLVVPQVPQLDLWEEAQRLSGRVHEQVLVSPRRESQRGRGGLQRPPQVRKCLV